MNKYSRVNQAKADGEKYRERVCVLSVLSLVVVFLIATYFADQKSWGAFSVCALLTVCDLYCVVYIEKHWKEIVRGNDISLLVRLDEMYVYYRNIDSPDAQRRAEQIKQLMNEHIEVVDKFLAHRIAQNVKDMTLEFETMQQQVESHNAQLQGLIECE